MRGINFQSLLKNWDLIVDKLCDEVSTHDILLVIRKNLEIKIRQYEENKFDTTKSKLALQKIDEILKLIDPEQF
jgi:hypothetical protein